MTIMRPVFVGSIGLAIAIAGCKSNDTADGQFLSLDALKDPVTCKKCHEQYYTEWSGSMHAYASKDPVFRAMNARGQRETHGGLGPFCVNCHAPMAVREELVNDAGTNLDTVDEKFQGVTCFFCHQVTSVNDTHNNPLVLANDQTMRGGIHDPISNSAHNAEYSELHDGTGAPSSKMCGSCHDIVVPAHFSGASEDQHLERTFEEWTGSLFAKTSGGIPNACAAAGCHMRTDKEVTIADYPGVPTRSVRHHHEFPGVDVALTDFPQKDTQLAEVTELLATSLRATLCVSDFGGRIKVTLENIAGHNFPSGASQDRRVWVEIHAYSDEARQREILSVGAAPKDEPITDLLTAVPPAWILRDVTTDKDGRPAHMFWDVANIDKQTIPAPLTTNPAEPGWHREAVGRAYTTSNGSSPQEVTMMVHVQPIGLDVLQDLVRTRDLAGRPGPGAVTDAGIGVDGGASLPALEMPTHDLVPNAANGETFTIDWTTAKAHDPTKGYPDDTGFCLDTAARLL